jgi:hypothetical protein
MGGLKPIFLKKTQGLFLLFFIFLFTSCQKDDHSGPGKCDEFKEADKYGVAQSELHFN